MKFTDRHTGIEMNLHKIKNTDYWHDLEGDLYEIDMYTGYCEKINAADALISLQLRLNRESGYCPVCDDVCLKTKAMTFKRNSCDGWPTKELS